MASDDPLTVQDLGEQGLLQRLQQFCPPDVVGDDAAVLATSPGKSLVVTTDLLIEGVHFSDRTTSAFDAGWRAAAANLSDLAAMGAVPLGITVGLGLPKTLSVAWLEALYQGITACLQTYSTVLVGGDVCRSSVTTLAITAFGEVNPAQVIRRSQAQPGDAIVVTGYHGASKAGLELLLHPDQPTPLTTEEKNSLIQAHQRPRPRLDVLPLLGERGAIAGMDSSDGLADAVIQICRASGVGARCDRAAIPIPPALKTWVGEATALHWALYGGEDFELVLCLPPQPAQALVAQLGTGAAIVGKISAEPGVWLTDTTGQSSPQPLTLDQGFQHF